MQFTWFSVSDPLDLDDDDYSAKYVAALLAATAANLFKDEHLEDMIGKKIQVTLIVTEVDE